MRVTIFSPFSSRFFGGKGERVVDAASIFDLVRKLDAEAPGFAAAAELGAAFGVDGVVVDDWTARLPEDAEVLVVPKVAGG